MKQRVMSIKIGDKVRFLNDVGGGVVVEIKEGDMVVVEYDNGFSFPISRAECVVTAQSVEPTPAIEPKVEKISKPSREEFSQKATEADLKKLIAKFSGAESTPKIKELTKPRQAIATTPEIVEVDLHIEKLLDSTAGMNSGDMLAYQLGHMRAVVEQYSRHRGLKLVFIHGKGDGVLRSAITQELKRMGLSSRLQEASFKRYGYGALMVVM